jgi:DNA-binding protein HU-beta
MQTERHIAKAASAEEIRRSLGVTPQEDERAHRILVDLGYLKAKREASKADLINRILESVEGMTRTQAAQALAAVFAAITEAVKTGESAKVPGFGSFTLSEHAARKGRNPATGQAITIRASKSVRFKPGKELQEALNAKRRDRQRSAAQTVRARR